MKNLLINLFMNNQIKKEYKELAKLLAVGIFADGKKLTVEEDYAKDVIKKEVESKHRNYVENLMNDKLIEYNNKKWLLQKEQLEVVEFILNDNNWTYADYLLGVIKSDGLIKGNETHIFNSLNLLVEQRKIIQSQIKKKT